MRPEQIPYGVKDFKRVRLEKRYYVDKSQFIEKLEQRADFLRGTCACVAKSRGLRSMNLPAIAGGTPGHFLCYEFNGRDLFRLEEVNPATGEKMRSSNMV